MFFPALLPTTHSYPVSLFELISLIKPIAHKEQDFNVKITKSESFNTIEVQSPHLLGRRQEDLELTLQDQLITLRSSSINLANDVKIKPVFEEFPLEPLELTLQLPDPVSDEELTANLSGDLLTIHLPKPPKLNRKISINTH
jgi:HSP20 family molecular chaperone IbpA